MCGRYKFTLRDEVVRLLQVEEIDLGDTRPENDDVRPTTLEPVVASDAPHRLVGMRWGLIPPWTKTEEGKLPAWVQKTFNARSEDAAEKPAFRGAFKAKRCLVPCDGFYEWTGDKGKKQKHFIGRADGAPMVFAGLWEHWNNPSGELVRSFTILTCEPNTLMAQLHNRMPVILDPSAFDQWMAGTVAEAQALCTPCPDAWLKTEAA